MSVASTDLAPRTWAHALAVVVGGDAKRRQRVSDILADEGFVASDMAKPGTIIVLLPSGPDTAHVYAVRDAAETHPESRVLAVMSAGVPNAAMRKAILAGATGIVLENDIERALGPTARAVLAGQLTVPVSLSRQIAPRPLSHREKQILSLVVVGLTNREIARRLYLAESTVKTHLSSAFRKIDARSRAEAVARIQDPEAGYGMAVLATVDDVSAPAA
jgi:DNA-binding NarL/FixJ family response regulator